MASPDPTQGKNVQQKQEKSKNEWFLQDHSRVVGNSEGIYCLKKKVNPGTRVSGPPQHRTATLRERGDLKSPKRNARSCRTTAARPRSPSGHFQTARPRSLLPCDCLPRLRPA